MNSGTVVKKMQTLILSDGTELTNSYAALTVDRLFLYIQNGMNLIQVFMLVSDPEKLDNIIYASGDHQEVYGGFKTLEAISLGVNGVVSVVLKR